MVELAQVGGGFGGVEDGGQAPSEGEEAVAGFVESDVHATPGGALGPVTRQGPGK